MYSVLHQKCPRCHEGNLFLFGTYSLRKFMQMPETCAVCGLRYEREPSFFYGAMYVSYAFQVIIVVVVGLILWLVTSPTVVEYIVAVVASTALLLPVNFRLGRAVWINLFVSYQENWGQK